MITGHSVTDSPPMIAILIAAQPLWRCCCVVAVEAGEGRALVGCRLRVQGPKQCIQSMKINELCPAACLCLAATYFVESPFPSCSSILGIPSSKALSHPNRLHGTILRMPRPTLMLEMAAASCRILVCVLMTAAGWLTSCRAIPTAFPFCAPPFPH